MGDKEIIAANLANYRKKAGLSQLELANKLQYSNKNISKWENGETTPNVFVLQKIATLYGITVDDLLREDTVEANQRVEIKAALDKRRKTIFQIAMLLLANAIMFALVSISIYVLGIVGVSSFNKWLMYLYVSPLCCLSVFIYVCVLHKYVEIVSLSLVGWLTCLSVYLSLLHVANIELIFVIGAAYQLIALCVMVLVNTKLPNKLVARIKKRIEKRKAG